MPRDTRATWCGLPFAHGPHGEDAKAGQCLGWNGPNDPSEPNGEPMTHGITKEVVRSTIDSLNDKAERMGWARRYEAQFGSNRNGVKHVLLTRTPERNHPVEQHPFATLSRLHNYLLAMGQALNDAVMERARQRTEAMTRVGEVEAVLRPFRDPDARAVRRQMEDQADFLSRPHGADQ